MTTTRRTFLFGLGATLAVIPATNLMKLYVPPKPKLIYGGFGPDWSGALYSREGEKVGWWTQKDGLMDFRWDDPAPTGYYHSGQNHSFATMGRVMQLLDVRPYPVRPFA